MSAFLRSQGGAGRPCSPEHGNSDNGVVRDDLGLDRGDAGILVIFCTFDGREVSALAACHQHADKRWIDSEGRRQLGRVEHRDTAARPGSNIEEPATMQHPVGDLIDGVRDALGLQPNRRRDERILLLDDADDVESRTPVDVETGVEPV
jgi:hypothetical protein